MPQRVKRSPRSAPSREPKERERRDLLLKTAAWLTAELTASSKPSGRVGGEYFTVDRRRIDTVVRRYFDEVERFKEENGFGDHLINEPKQAALMVREIMLAHPISARANAPDTIHREMANAWYAYAVALDLIGVELQSVGDDIAAETLFFIRHGHRDVRTAMLLFELLRRCGHRPPKSRWWALRLFRRPTPS